MITLLTGLPRNGKSFKALKLLIKELKEGTRPIKTNLPILVEKLRAYCVKRGIPERLLSRVEILTNEQVGTFWRFRNSIVKVNTPLDVTRGATPLEFVEDGGVFYLIDEAHLKFRSHDWDKLGVEAPFYTSQHGHLDDDVILITQHVDKLVKALRLDVQLYVEIEYMRRQHWLVFQKGYHFKAKYWTAGIPETLTTKPNSIEAFFPDKELMGCYDSKAGHGIERISSSHGREGFKGAPPWLAWMICVGLVYLGFKFIVSVPGYIMDKVGGGKGQKTETSQVAKSADGKQANNTQTPVEGNAQSAGEAKVFRADGRLQDALVIRGIAIREMKAGLRYNIQLSDGRVITEHDGVIKKVNRNSVQFTNGDWLYLDERWRGLSDGTKALVDRYYATQQGNAALPQGESDEKKGKVEEMINDPNLYGRIERMK